jgi:glycosyltransferase involved in cell wall biosynthesis
MMNKTMQKETNKSYKIGFILPFLESQGGVTVSVQTIKDYLEKMGHEVHLFPIGKTLIEPSLYIHPINTNNKLLQMILTKKKIWKENDKKSFDLLISNNLISNKILNQIDCDCKKIIVLRQPSLLKNENALNRLVKKIQYPQIYNNQNIIAISECLRSAFEKKFAYIKPKSFSVIYNAFDPEEIKILADKPYDKIDEDYIINAGRFTKTKNQAMLIKAFKNIENKNIKLVLLGDGKNKKGLKHLVNKLDLQERVIFINWVKNPFPYIKNAKLLVNTSRSETFGRAILEALALSTPTISTDISCGPNEILTGELAKFLVQIDDIPALTELINEALKKYPVISDNYLNKFLISNIAQEYLKMIE